MEETMIASQFQSEMTEMIVRTVEVDYDIPPEKAISATKRVVEYLNGGVVSSMPCNGKGKKKVEVYFFPLRKCTSAEDVRKLIEQHSLKPDPYAVSKVNEQDSAFANKCPNGTQWVDGDGKYCYLAFGCWRGERYVLVNPREDVWPGAWWVGGVRK